MSRWKVYVTNEIPKPALDMLEEYCDMEVNRTGHVLEKSVLLEKVKGRDAILSLLTDPIDAEVMDAAKGAKIFANYAVGYNNIDIPSATERGIMVSNTPGFSLIQRQKWLGLYCFLWREESWNQISTPEWENIKVGVQCFF